MKPQIRIFKDMETLSRNAADLFVDQASQSIRERGGFLVALNGGSTPTRLFQLLSADYRDKVDWNRTHIFWGDERLVSVDDPESSYGQAQTMLLRHVPLPEINIHRIHGELAPTESVQEYASVLKKSAAPPLDFPRFDLIYLGMGEDGHTASLFPGSALDVTEPLIAVMAQYQNRPAQRVTLTPMVFNQARLIAFMAIGEKKAHTLAEVLSGRYRPEVYPAQRIEPKDGKVIWLVDEDAASKLPMDLVRRFCEG
jgi:6-phosphogluconolactonase